MLDTTPLPNAVRPTGHASDGSPRPGYPWPAIAGELWTALVYAYLGFFMPWHRWAEGAVVLKNGHFVVVTLGAGEAACRAFGFWFWMFSPAYRAQAAEG